MFDKRITLIKLKEFLFQKFLPEFFYSKTELECHLILSQQPAIILVETQGFSLPVLRNSSDLNIRNRRFLSLLLRQNRSKPLRFFVVLIGFRRDFNVRIVGFCHSKNLTNRTVPARIRALDPYVSSHLRLHCITCPLVLLYFFCI